MAVKLSNMIIGALFITFFAVVITVFVGKVYTQTGETGNQNLSFLNKSKDIQNIINETERKAQEFDTGIEIVDLVGAYLISAKGAVDVAAESTDTLKQMSDSSLDQLPESNSIMSTLKVTLSASLAIAIILGVIIAIFTKRDM